MLKKLLEEEIRRLTEEEKQTGKEVAAVLEKVQRFEKQVSSFPASIPGKSIRRMQGIVGFEDEKAKQQWMRIMDRDRFDVKVLDRIPDKVLPQVVSEPEFGVAYYWFFALPIGGGE